MHQEAENKPRNRSLADAPGGVPFVIIALEMSEHDKSWLEAVGLHEGQRVAVLRHGAFGGPVHVRTGDGAEFAIGRSIALGVLLGQVP